MRGEKGISSIFIIAIAALVVFILWEISAQSGILAELNHQFALEKAAKNAGKGNCNFALASDPCDLDSGTGFDKSGL